jgi:hypothetical protein
MVAEMQAMVAEVPQEQEQRTHLQAVPAAMD